MSGISANVIGMDALAKQNSDLLEWKQCELIENGGDVSIWKCKKTGECAVVQGLI